MDFPIFLLILGVGLAAGFLNTVAGGGSLLTLPVLILAGLSPLVANATNRVAIAVQNVFSVAGFKSKGFFYPRYTGLLAVTATMGSILGAKVAIDISGELFQRILAIVMIGVLCIIIFNRRWKWQPEKELLDWKHQWGGAIFFFFIGIYGGFIQAGVGFIIMAMLNLYNGLDLVKTNSIKVGVVLIYTLAALIVFALEGSINWRYGFLLSIGNGVGGWLASRWSVQKGEKWIRPILVVSILAMAIKLLGFF